DGQYIYFNTNRTQPSYPYGMRESDLYRMPLTKIDKPYRSNEFDKLFAKAEDKKESKKEDDKSGETDKKKEKDLPKVTIDFERPMKRIERVGPSFGRQFGSYIVQKDGKTHVVFTSNHDEGKTNLWLLTMEDFEKPKTEKIAGAETGRLAIRSAKDKHYVLVKGNIHSLNLSGKKTEQIKINHSFQRNLQNEFEQMYYETWANMEENFYNESFHGIDWEKMRDQYAGFLPHVNSRADLRRMVNDMLGELNTSHFGFYSNGKEEKLYYGTRTLATGIVFNEDNPWQVDGVVEHSPADREGIDLRPGDVLVAVNGKAVDPKMNREYYFAKASMEEEITLGLERSGAAVEVKLHPTSYTAIRNALYDEWIEKNQQRVDKKSDQRIAYVYMKNMTGGQLEQFQIDMMSEAWQRDCKYRRAHD
ncbi:MAG: PDZ domain-containing protein, partial [Bacteroidota bacterium]